MTLHRFRWLHTMRGLACLIVMCSHIIASNPVYGMYANGCGKIGVWLFMLMSGFLFAHSDFYTREKITVRRVLTFYKEKALRLLPEYILALSFALALGLIDRSTLKDILVFRGTWGHFWYMSVVIKFYLIAPLLAVFRRHIIKRKRANRRRLLQYCSMLFFLIIALAVLFPYTNYPENSIELKWYLPVFLMGIIIAESKRLLDGRYLWLDFLFPAGIIIILMLTPLGRKWLFGIEPSGYLQNKYLLIGFLWTLSLMGILYGKYTGKILARSVFLKTIADYSYELYLFHYCILCWLGIHYTNMQSWVRGIITILISAVLSVFIKKLVAVAKTRIDDRVCLGIVCAATATLLIWR